MKQMKNNLLTKLQTWVMLLVTVLLFGHTSKADIVYNNSVNRSTNGSGDALVFAQSGYEYGDEVVLAGTTARYLTNFAIEYYQNGIPAGATMRLRIYSNDGTAYGTNFNAPGSLLYDSSAFNVGGNTDGFHSLTFNQANSGLAIPVGGSFTWTVEFGGVTSGSAALSLYDAPTVGTDYNQYWEASGTTNSTAPWVYRLGSGGLNVNFGAIADAADKSADVTAPSSLAFSSPADKAEIPLGFTNISGSVKDAGGKISLVLVKVQNFSNYRPASLSSVGTGTGAKTNWTATGVQLNVNPTNKVIAKAVDWAGNFSTNFRTFAYTVSQPFTVTQNIDGTPAVGGGTLELKGAGLTTINNGNTYTQNLVVSRAYSIKLKPTAHNYLSNSILTAATVTTYPRTTLTYNFTMNTNYGVVVNWATNRFYRDFGVLASANQKHYGLVGEETTNQATAGFIMVQIKASDMKNTASGKLTIAGEKEQAFTAIFDLDGDAVSGIVTNPILGGTYVVRVHAPFDSSDEVSGSVSNCASSVVSTFTAGRDTWTAINLPSAYDARYVMAVPGGISGPTGYANWPFKMDSATGLGKVDTGGDGYLADGSKIKQLGSPKISKTGEWPMYMLDTAAAPAGLTAKVSGLATSSVHGWLQFNAGVGISGTAKIIRTATDNANANYATGYTNVADVIGEVWTNRGTVAVRAIDLGVGGVGTLSLAGGALGGSTNITITAQLDGKTFLTSPRTGSGAGVGPLLSQVKIKNDTGKTDGSKFTVGINQQNIFGVGFQGANRIYGFFRNAAGFPFVDGSVEVAP